VPEPHGRSQTGKKAFWYPDFTNRPDQKTKGLNPGDSANPNTAIIFAFCIDSTLKWLRQLFRQAKNRSPAV
jgi:hypothetical protein